MAKKIKLTQEQRIEKYKKASALTRAFIFLSLPKADRVLLKQQKAERKNSYVEKNKDFDARHNSFEIKNFNLWFGAKHALKDITCNIQKKKVTVVIGPNGCGKSVLLRSLNRMNRVYAHNVEMSGNIWFFNGTNLYSDKIQQVELTTRVGTITQKPTPFPMSIYDNVAYGPRNHGITNKKALDKIVHDALDDAALWNEVKDRLNDYASNLSNGQQQRLCIARAIALKPEVLLMDQPTGGLDPIATTFVENLILQLKHKYTIVVVTHSLTQAQRISDNCLFLRKGHLIESGTTRQMFSNPQQKRTKDFILGR